jgi:hypothetical protein
MGIVRSRMKDHGVCFVCLLKIFRAIFLQKLMTNLPDKIRILYKKTNDEISEEHDGKNS